jgi:hypothetical protein
VIFSMISAAGVFFIRSFRSGGAASGTSFAGTEVRAENRTLRTQGCGTQFRCLLQQSAQDCLRGLGGFFFGVGYELFVGAFEVVDFGVVEVPDAGGYFVDYVVVVSYE